MNKEYLLTYENQDGNCNFEWFYTEDEMTERAEELKNTVSDIEGLHIRVIEKLI